MSTPVAAVRYGPSITSCTTGKAKNPTCAARANERVTREHDEQQGDRDGERKRRVDRSAADEGEDAAPTPEAGEDRERMTDHRGAGADVGEAPHPGTGECDAHQRSDRALGHIADEHRDRRPLAQRLACVPEPRVPVADRAQIDPCPASRDQVRDRDRADEIADDDRDHHVDGGLRAHW